MKKVITYGSFDLFHEGHYKLLQRAKALGDYLIVGVTTENYDEMRGKLNVIDSIMERIENVRKTGFADRIIIEDHPGQKVEDIQKYQVDIFAIGSDWIGEFEYLKKYCEVVYLERTKGVSSTMKRAVKYDIVHMGIMGTGRIADRFVPEAKYVSGLDVNSVYNPRISSARNFAEYHQLGFFTADEEEFYQRVDAVNIATPHATHYKYARNALEHGKHVLCEKPITLTRSQAKELYDLADSKGLVLMEAIKTAYLPGFIRLMSLIETGIIGEIKDVEACFTRLTQDGLRELVDLEGGGSFTEFASYTLLPMIKLLGAGYKDVRFECINADNGLDTYAKAYFTYDNAFALSKTGLKVKSDGHLVVAGTKGYIMVPAPWWKTTEFEICYEDFTRNEKVYTKYLGEGLRYELSDFVSTINGFHKGEYKLTKDESIAIAGVIEKFLQWREEQQ